MKKFMLLIFVLTLVFTVGTAMAQQRKPGVDFQKALAECQAKYTAAEERLATAEKKYNAALEKEKDMAKRERRIEGISNFFLRKGPPISWSSQYPVIENPALVKKYSHSYLALRPAIKAGGAVGNGISWFVVGTIKAPYTGFCWVFGIGGKAEQAKADKVIQPPVKKTPVPVKPDNQFHIGPNDVRV